MHEPPPKGRGWTLVIWAVLQVLTIPLSILHEMLMVSWLAIGAAWVITLVHWLWTMPPKTEAPPERHTLKGSAQWAARNDARAADLYVPFHGSYFCTSWPIIGRDPDTGEPMQYPGDRHLLTVAPTRSGKGVGTVIPNLLTWPGSVIVIDPKGELCRATAALRMRAGQYVHVIDPWGDIKELPASRFNPLAYIYPDSPDMVEDAMTLADALVISGGGEQFWPDEAKALIAGLILHVVTDPNETEQTLGRVREILCLPPADFAAVVTAMAGSSFDAVRNAAGRILQKSDRELSSVISTAQQNTHFLDSPRIRNSLSEDDINFYWLKHQYTTIYVVLPQDRLATYNRWLRLLVSMALTLLGRTPRGSARPVLMMIDEFPALGYLKPVENAYGIAAGLGVQIWTIIQDFNQLAAIYGTSWKTFLANAGVIQAFGTRDTMTAQELSAMLGVGTVELISQHTAEMREWDPGYCSMHDQLHPRELMKPDEILNMPQDRQLLFVAGQRPIMARKIKYYEDMEFRIILNGTPLELLPEQHLLKHNPLRPEAAAKLAEERQAQAARPVTLTRWQRLTQPVRRFRRWRRRLKAWRGGFFVPLRPSFVFGTLPDDTRAVLDGTAVRPAGTFDLIRQQGRRLLARPARAKA